MCNCPSCSKDMVIVSEQVYETHRRQMAVCIECGWVEEWCDELTYERGIA
jgi:uncharacterized Zn finger protein